MAVELRIHGVSGTPPSQMLDGSVIADERFVADPPLVHRPAGGDGTLLSFRWASRTSGSASSAMWLLLVPYMLLNLAGWALPPASDQRHRSAVAVVRVAGLLLTLIFAMVTATGVIGVGAYQVVRPRTSWSTALLAGVATSVLLLILLWFVTTRAEQARNDRPYLRSPHMAIALWGVWATAVTAAAESADSPEPIGSMWLLPVALCVMAAASSLWPGLEELTRLVGRIAIVGVTLLLLSVVLRPLDELQSLPDELLTIGGPLRGAVIAYAVAGIVATGLAWVRSHPDAGPVVGTLLALAGSTGAAVGAGAIVVSGAVFGVAAPLGARSLAEAFLAGTLLLVAVTALHFWIHLEPGSSRVERLARTTVSVRDDIRPLLLAVCVVTVAVATLGVFRAGDVLGWVTLGAAPVAALSVWWLSLKLGYRAASGLAVAIPGVVGLGVGMEWWTLGSVAVTSTLVIPLLAVVARVVGAWRNENRRRILAIPWDVGSFFSRRFHPFAPPTYRDVVERDLTMVLAQLRTLSEPVVVSAHSQGSIIAATTLSQIVDGTPLLTHGSPLGPLYMRFFPRSFPADTVSRIGPRPWINLWRVTDPIGGAIRGVDDRRLGDPRLRIHGAYWLEDAYASAFAEIVESGRPGRR